MFFQGKLITGERARRQREAMANERCGQALPYQGTVSMTTTPYGGYATFSQQPYAQTQIFTVQTPPPYVAQPTTAPPQYSTV